MNGSENRCPFIFDKKYDELRWLRLTRVTAYGMNVFRRFVKYLPGTKPAKHTSANLHLNFPVENIDNRVRIMPVDRVAGSWAVIDSNDFNLFTRCFRKRFRKERIHLLGMRCRGKSEGKNKYKEDELLHVMPRFCLFGDVLRYPMEGTQNQKRHLGNNLSILISCLFFGRETHASTTQCDPLLLPTRNGPCRENGALHWEYLFYRVQRPPL